MIGGNGSSSLSTSAIARGWVSDMAHFSRWKVSGGREQKLLLLSLVSDSCADDDATFVQEMNKNQFLTSAYGSALTA